VCTDFDTLVLLHEALPEIAEGVVEDLIRVGPVHVPIAPRDLGVELPGRPARIAHVRVKATLGCALVHHLTQRLGAGCGVHVGDHGLRFRRRDVRADQEDHELGIHGPTQEDTVLALAELAERGQQRGELDLSGSIDDDSERARCTVLEQQDDGFGEEGALQLAVGDQKATAGERAKRRRRRAPAGIRSRGCGHPEHACVGRRAPSAALRGSVGAGMAERR
jgi:hypothetical protein